MSNQKDSLSFVSLQLSDISIDVMEEEDAETEKRKKINTVEYTDFRQKKKENYVNYSNDIFNKLEKRDHSLKQKTLCSDQIVKSSGKPVVLDIKDHTTRPFSNIERIAQMKNDRDTLSKYNTDNFNNDFYIIPFHEVLCKTYDRKILIHASLMELPVEHHKNGKRFVYEFAWATNLHDLRNKQIAGVILEFLDVCFYWERNHVRALLTKESTTVLMILNLKSDLSDKVFVTHIVSLVIFGNDDLVNTCIDFVTTTTPFSGMSFGPFLIHAAQVFG